MKIKIVKRLPEWMTPDKYAALSEFDAAQWLEQLRYRRHLLRGNPIYPIKSKAANVDDLLLSWITRNGSSISDLCKAPLTRSGPMSAFIVEGKPSASTITVGDFTYPVLGLAPLRSMTLRDLVDQARHDRSPEARSAGNAERWDYVSANHDFGRLPSGFEDLDILLGAEENPVLVVDITAGDSEIQEYFDAWLRKARKARHLKYVRRSEPKYAKWVAYGVLPYLDAKIWSMQSGEKPTDKIIAQFVAEVSGDSSVDATKIGGVTAITAKELMSAQSEKLAELESLAVLEREVRKH